MPQPFSWRTSVAPPSLRWSVMLATELIVLSSPGSSAAPGALEETEASSRESLSAATPPTSSVATKRIVRVFWFMASASLGLGAQREPGDRAQDHEQGQDGGVQGLEARAARLHLLVALVFHAAQFFARLE